MKIESSPREDHQVTLTVEFESEIVEEAKRRAARKIARRVRIPGFRPGKAPYPVILRQVGEAEITEHALEELVDEKYKDIISESGIHPYAPGNLEKVVSLQPMVLEFVVPLEAEVQLGDYQVIRIPYDAEPITDKDVDDVIENMRERRAILEPVERAAGEDDSVTIKLSAQRTNPVDDEDSELLPEYSRDILIRKQDSETQPATEWPYPGFSRELIGAEIGDEKTLTHQFSEDYEYTSLQGVEASYHLVVEGIKSRQLPELDDNFAKTVGDHATVEDLKVKVRSDLENYRKDEYNEKYDERALDQLVEGATFLYPPQMLEQEIDSMVSNFEKRMEQQGATLDLYLKTRELDLAGFQEEVKPLAETRIKRQLALFELAKSEGIDIQPDELKQETDRTIEYLSKSLSEKEARQLSTDRVRSNLVGNILVDLLTHKAVEKLRSIASQTETQIDIEQSETVDNIDTTQIEDQITNDRDQDDRDQDDRDQIVTDLETTEAESVAVDEI